jgi:hypothetical protein
VCVGCLLLGDLRIGPSGGILNNPFMGMTQIVQTLVPQLSDSHTRASFANALLAAAANGDTFVHGLQ